MTTTAWGFAGDTAVVTGAASGIGHATARMLCDSGLRVVLLDRDADALARVATELGPTAIAATVDIAEEADIARALAEALGDTALSYVAHCAGIHQSVGLAALTDQDWTQMLSINLVGAFNVARSCLPYLRRADDAAIVNVTSIEAHRVVALANPNSTPHYAAAKAGLAMLTKSLAHEFAADGIRVNAVAPGIVDTPMITYDHRAGTTESDVPIAFVDHLLVKRYAQPAEIAAAICFLLSTSSSYITATTITVDGGFTAI